MPGDLIVIDGHTYASFVVAAAVIVAAPGPSVALVVSHALTRGTGQAVHVTIGEGLAHVLFISIAMSGLAPLLGALAGAFTWIKLIGAAYLVWLGVRQWRTGTLPSAERAMASEARALGYGARGFLVTITNPKALVFYAAFFPPFVSPNAPIGPQLVVLGATFVGIFLIITLAFALLAARVRVVGARSRTRDRLSGGMLIGAGVALVAVDRN